MTRCYSCGNNTSYNRKGKEHIENELFIVSEVGLDIEVMCIYL